MSLLEKAGVPGAYDPYSDIDEQLDSQGVDYGDETPEERATADKRMAELAARRQGAAAPETAATPTKTAIPLKTDAKRVFTADELLQLKAAAHKRAQDHYIQRNHYAAPELNPVLHGEGAMQQAHDEVFGPMHQAWQNVSDSDTFRGASLPQQWRMQQDFLTKWHEAHPEFSTAAVDAITNAHGIKGKANIKRAQHERDKLRDATLGGGIGDMSDAAAHQQLGVSAGADEAPSANIQQTGRQVDPEAAKRALEGKRFKNLQEEPVDVEARTTAAPLKGTSGAQSQLENDFAARYLPLMGKNAIEAAKKSVGAQGKMDVDEAAMSDSAQTAMWLALHRHDASKGHKLDTGVRRAMRYALEQELKRQYKSSGPAVGTQEKQASQASAAPVKVFSPEEKSQLEQQLKQRDAGQIGRVEAAAAAPITTPSTPEAPAAPEKPVSQTPKFAQHLDDEQKQRLTHINSAKTIIRKPGGGQ